MFTVIFDLIYISKTHILKMLRFIWLIGVGKYVIKGIETML